MDSHTSTRSYPSLLQSAAHEEIIASVQNVAGNHYHLHATADLPGHTGSVTISVGKSADGTHHTGIVQLAVAVCSPLLSPVERDCGWCLLPYYKRTLKSRYRQAQLGSSADIMNTYCQSGSSSSRHTTTTGRTREIAIACLFTSHPNKPSLLSISLPLSPLSSFSLNSFVPPIPPPNTHTLFRHCVRR